jgi:hypothetical protein
LETTRGEKRQDQETFRRNQVATAEIAISWN